MRKAIYPGSFDPITNGHVDIINRGLNLYDEIIIGILNNQSKSSLFDLITRRKLIFEAFKNNLRVKIISFHGLLVNFAVEQSVYTVIRGLRAASDFEYEYQLAAMNRKLCSQVETVFLMTSNETFFLSSSLVKEVALLGGDISKMVPACVVEAFNNRKKYDKNYSK